MIFLHLQLKYSIGNALTCTFNLIHDFYHVCELSNRGVLPHNVSGSNDNKISSLHVPYIDSSIKNERKHLQWDAGTFIYIILAGQLCHRISINLENM